MLTTRFSQLFLRVALSISFLSAVADRFGLWGTVGAPSVAWGNWQNFIRYSNSINSFVSPQIGEDLAVIATILEILIPILLIIGFKTRLTAITSGFLLSAFALAMTISFGIKPPLDYSVWTGSAASFLLSRIAVYEFSIDNLTACKRR